MFGRHAIVIPADGAGCSVSRCIRTPLLTGSVLSVAALRGLALVAGVTALISLAVSPASAADYAAGGGVINAPSGSATAVGSGATTTGVAASAYGAGSDANGGFATATGAFSAAAGGEATATGYNALATGSGATATGVFSVATGDNATATGVGSLATGTNATATGALSVASGATATAYGEGSNATGNAVTAIGPGSQAPADGATALGAGATAAFANSTAIGAGATTTAANQMAFGTASTTYRMAGITSAASLAAQSGPVSVVTTDAAGHLATASFSPQDISTLQSNVGQLQQQMKQGFEGTAIAIAMGASALPTDKKFALSTNWGTFRGQNAMGFAAQMRVSQYVVLNGGIGAGFAQGGIGGRAGVTVAW